MFRNWELLRSKGTKRLRFSNHRPLRLMALEDRRVLSADFTLGAAGLVIDGFDTETNAITIAQVGDEFHFTLSAGDWFDAGRGNESDAPSTSVEGQTLAVETSVLESLPGGIRVAATPGLDLAVTLGDADFSRFAGGVEIVGASSLGQTSGSVVASPALAPLAVITPSTGLELSSINVTGDFEIEFDGPITDTPGSNISINGDATFISRASGPSPVDLTNDGTVNGADLSLWATSFGTSNPAADLNNDTTVNIADYTVLRDLASSAGSHAGIFLANETGDSFQVTGQATFEAQSPNAAARFSIEVGVNSNAAPTAAATVEFGSLSLFGGDALIAETDATVLNDGDVSSLRLSSGGSITDTGTTNLNVAGLASLNSLTDEAITLDDLHNFGTLAFDGGTVTIVEQSGTELAAGLSEAESLILQAAGAITDSPGVDGPTTLLVENNASFTSTTGDDITLDDTHDFGSLTFSGGAVTIFESTATLISSAAPAPSDGVAASVAPGGTGTILSGISFANTLALNSDGAITDDGTADVTVLANARFDAINDDDITLDDVYRLGSLTFDGREVEIVEADTTVLSGASNAFSLAIESSGSITDDGTANLLVPTEASFDSLTDQAITLDDTYVLGSIEFNGGAVLIETADNVAFFGNSAADYLVLRSLGSIDGDIGNLSVTNHAFFQAVNNDSIAFGSFPLSSSSGFNFGSLAFDGGAVTIAEGSATVLAEDSQASSLLLTSGGSITDDGTANVSVTNNANFDAFNSDSITLDDTHNFGSLTFQGGDILIVEDSSTELAGDSDADTLDLQSRGEITDATGTELVVAGLAQFTSLTGEAITLDETVNFGTLRFNGGAVTIAEDSDTLLTGESLAFTLDLSSTGAIDDDGSVDLRVLENARFDALNDDDITLTDTHRFGSLTFDGGGVSITEADGTVFSGVSSATSLAIDSAGSITDDDTADVTVTDNASFDALNDDAINLDDTYNFGTLTFDGGDVFVREASDTLLEGFNSAVTLRIESTGAIATQLAAALTVIDNATFNSLTESDILLGRQAFAVVAVGSLTFNGGNVEITEFDGTVLSGDSNALSLDLASNGSITDDGLASLNVVNNAAFVAFNGDAITLDDTLNFGSLTFDGGTVLIVEGSDTVLTGTSRAESLDLSANGSITDLASSDLGVTGFAEFQSFTDAEITLGDAPDEIVMLGSVAFRGGDVSADVDGALTLADTTLADTLTFSASGPISDAPSADVEVLGNASFTTPGDITLDAAHRFGTLTFAGAAVDITEQDDTELAGASDALTLVLRSGGSITDADDASLSVSTFGTGTAVLESDGSILLADAANPLNQLVLFDASLTAGLGGDPNAGIVLGATLGGVPTDAFVAINLIATNAPGNVIVAVDDTIDPPAPAAAPLVDSAFESLALDDLQVDDDLDALAEDLAAA